MSYLTTFYCSILYYHALKDSAILKLGLNGGFITMKTKSLLLLSLFLAFGLTSYAHAQDDDAFIPEDETVIPSSGTSSTPPPIIIDESDSSDVSDVEEYDG